MPRRPWLTQLLILLTSGAAWGADSTVSPAPRVYSLRISIAVDLSLPGRPDAPVVVPPIPSPPAPVVPPTPTPTPTPTPSPQEATATRSFVVVLYDRSKRTPALASILDSTTLGPALRAAGFVWRNTPSDDPSIVGSALASHAAKVGLPALIVVDAASGIHPMACPSTEAEVIAKAKELGVAK